MDECDSGPPPAGTSDLVDQPGAGGLEMLEGVVDRGNGECDMVEPFPVSLQEAADRGVRGEGLQQLDERAPHRDHRLFDALCLHGLPVERLDPVPPPVPIQGLVEILNRDADVIEIEQLHPMKAIGRHR